MIFIIYVLAIPSLIRSLPVASNPASGSVTARGCAWRCNRLGARQQRRGLQLHFVPLILRIRKHCDGSAGADLDARSRFGYTVIENARDLGHWEVLKELERLESQRMNKRQSDVKSEL